MSKVAITIDTEFPDRPVGDPLGTCDRLLALLAAQHVPATFFVVGSWAKAYPDRVKAIESAGHLVGNHGYSHCSLEKMTDEGIVGDLTDGHDAIAAIGIETRPWFRAPYGEMGEEGGRIYDAVEGASYRHVRWHAHGSDWDPTAAVDQIVVETIAGVHKRWPQPAIVLFHSWPDRTPDALTGVLDALRPDGAEFVTVAALD